MKNIFVVILAFTSISNANLCYDYFYGSARSLQAGNLSQQAMEILEVAAHTLMLPGKTIEEQASILADQMNQMHAQIAEQIQRSSDKVLNTPVRSLEKMTSESGFMVQIKQASQKLTEIKQQGQALESTGGFFRSTLNRLRGVTIGKLEEKVQTLEGFLKSIIETSTETSSANIEQMRMLDEGIRELSEFRNSLYLRKEALEQSIPEIEVFLDARLVDNPNAKAIKDRVMLDLHRQLLDTQDLISLTNSLIANSYEQIAQKRAALSETQRRLQTVPIHIRHLLISEIARLGTVRQIEANNALDRMTTAAINQQAEGAKQTQKSLEALSSRQLFNREALANLEKALIEVEQSRATYIQKQLLLIEESRKQGQELIERSERLLENSQSGQRLLGYQPESY